jgi:hypothetical protein
VGNAVTINCGGTDRINTSTGGTSLTLSVLNQGVVLQYLAGSPGVWYVLGDDIPLAAPRPAMLDAVGSSGATQTLSVLSGGVQTVTLSADCTFTFDNPPSSPASAAWSFTLILTQGASGGPYTAAFTGGSTSVKWAGGTAPTLSTGANDVDILQFTTANGGTSWYGTVAGLNFH